MAFGDSAHGDVFRAPFLHVADSCCFVTAIAQNWCGPLASDRDCDWLQTAEFPSRNDVTAVAAREWRINYNDLEWSTPQFGLPVGAGKKPRQR